MKALQRLISTVLFLYVAVIIVCAPFILAYFAYTGLPLTDYKAIINALLHLSTRIYGLFLIIHLITPMPVFCHLILKEYPDRKKCKRGHWLFDIVKTTAKAMNMSTPKVYIVASNQPNAFAFSTPFSSITCVTTKLVDLCDTREELAWVIAHELSHIKNRDSLSHAWFIAAIKTINLYFDLLTSIYNRLLSATVSVVNIFLPATVATLAGQFLLLALNIFVIAQTTTLKVFRFLFELIDRSIDREMEYRCDKDAAKVYGAAPGQAILSKLGGGIEPSFQGVMSTHPITSKRIAAISGIEGKIAAV